MTLIGILWAVAAPLLLLVAGAIVAFLLRRARAPRATPLAAVIVLGTVMVFWLYDRSKFVEVCEGEGKPVVYRRAAADGVFLNSGTSNSFGMRYIQEEGFKWVEAASIYKRNAWVRYERFGNGSIVTNDIPELTAEYEVREVFSQPYGHTGLSRTQVVDRASGDVLAKAASATFDGGRMKIVLGAWGVRSCPSAMTSSEDFNAFYHLAKNALR